MSNIFDVNCSTVDSNFKCDIAIKKEKKCLQKNFIKSVISLSLIASHYLIFNYPIIRSSKLYLLTIGYKIFILLSELLFLIIVFNILFHEG